ncbi:MAG: FecR domain-containing protein [Bacteroidota bacterium]
MNKQYNNIEDFLTDESFRSWVTNPTPSLDNQWRLWIDENPESKVLLEEAKAFAKSLKFKEFKPAEASKGGIFENVKSGSAKRSLSVSYRTWYKVAALIVIGFAFSLIYYNSIPDIAEKDVVVEESRIIQKSNPGGIKSQHMLPDGSMVHLNSKSSIEYPKKFKKDVRTVRLVGEAYFDIAEDSNRPFKVIFDGFEVEVLGTQFNVNSSLQDPEVALLEGKIQLFNRGTDKSIILKPGEKVSMNLMGGDFILSSFDSDHVSGWKDGILSFQDASFTEVLSKLNAWYGIEIALANQPKSFDWSYTASFRNESLANVLRSMSTLRDFDYEIENDSLVISFN